MQNRIIRHLNNISLHRRLLFSNLIIYITLTVVVVITISTVSMHRLVQQGKYNLRQNSAQAESFLSTDFATIVSLSRSIVMNPSLNSLIIGQYSNGTELNTAARDIRAILQSAEMNYGISHISVYMDDDWEMAVDNLYIRPLSSIENTRSIRSLMQNKPILFVSEESGPDLKESCISLFRIMQSTNNYRQLAYILRIDIPMQEVVQILDNASPADGSLIFIYGPEGMIAQSNTDGENGFSSLQPDIISELESYPEGDIHKLNLNRSVYMSKWENLGFSGWKLYSLVPYSSLTVEFSQVLLFVLLFAAISILLIVFLYKIITITITDRIQFLCNVLQTSDQDIPHPIPTNGYKDEIGILYDSYNSMTQKIQNLLAENYMKGRDLKNAEYQTLQAQINPHFLYNTLDMISWYAIQGKSDKIPDVVYSLAKFYKISLAKGKNIIPLSEEIQHVQCYMKLQQYRFSHEIEFFVDVDPDILPFSIPKITLQPLVENAISHGIRGSKNTHHGRIELIGRLNGSTIVLSVIDNGKGLEHNGGNNDHSEDTTSHYGIMNINNRIHLLYGNDYGVSLSTNIYSEGATAVVTIPAVKSEDILASDLSGRHILADN